MARFLLAVAAVGLATANADWWAKYNKACWKFPWKGIVLDGSTPYSFEISKDWDWTVNNLDESKGKMLKPLGPREDDAECHLLPSCVWKTVSVG